MSPKSFLLTPELHQYVLEHGDGPDEIQRRLIRETEALGAVSGMQIAPEQGAFLTLITRLVGATNAVEVGTFTGYSALCIARGLAEGGRLLCCDVSEDWTSVGRRYWQEAGVADRIDLRIAPALDTLRALPTEPVIDLAFVDADKAGYAAYYEALVPRLRTGGALMVDNTLWGGHVIQPEAEGEDLAAIRAFNDLVAADARTETVLLPVADGLTLCRKR